MEKILLVEDDEPLAVGIAFSLEREGFAVTTARYVAEALELFRKNTYNLLLLDVMLPDGNGYDICRTVRHESSVPVIFLTACDEEVNIVQGLDLGGDDYITKPFKVKELVSRLRAALRRAPSGQAGTGSCLSSGDIRVFPLQTKVVKANEEIYLTPVEFRLLSMFLQNPRQTLSREQILEKLWDINGDFVNDNALSVFIRRLREKLEDDPAHPVHILTVRGMGYRWEQGN